MAEEAIALMKELAQSPLVMDGFGEFYCPHCYGYEDEHGGLEHAARCAVVRARDWLNEHGISLEAESIVEAIDEY